MSEHEFDPRAEPDEEVSDPHTGPLDNEDDARYLDPSDSRRRQVEADRGRPFTDDDSDDSDYDWVDPTLDREQEQM